MAMSHMALANAVSKKLTWLSSFCLRHGVLLSSCQELPEPGDGHLGVYQLTNQLRQLKQRHPQNLQAVEKFELAYIPVQVIRKIKIDACWL